LPHDPFADEHAALLQDPSAYDLLCRKNDLFDDGVATIFGVRQGQAELQAFCFHPGRFTPEEARAWLRERGLEPRHFSVAGWANPD